MNRAIRDEMISNPLVLGAVAASLSSLILLETGLPIWAQWSFGIGGFLLVVLALTDRFVVPLIVPTKARDQIWNDIDFNTRNNVLNIFTEDYFVRRLSLTLHTVRRVLKRLQREGLVEREGENWRARKH